MWKTRKNPRETLERNAQNSKLASDANANRESARKWETQLWPTAFSRSGHFKIRRRSGASAPTTDHVLGHISSHFQKSGKFKSFDWKSTENWLKVIENRMRCPIANFQLLLRFSWFPWVFGQFSVKTDSKSWKQVKIGFGSLSSKFVHFYDFDSFFHWNLMKNLENRWKSTLAKFLLPNQKLLVFIGFQLNFHWKLIQNLVNQSNSTLVHFWDF